MQAVEAKHGVGFYRPHLADDDIGVVGHGRQKIQYWRVEEINLMTTSSDKSFLRTTMAYESFRDVGCPWMISFPIRVQQNNSFFSVSILSEHPDETWLKRNGLDPNGAFYKMFNALESVSGADKRTLDTPALIVDLDVMEENIARIAATCRKAGIHWRPHTKGQKVPAIADKLQRLKRTRLARESAKLNPREEKRLADEGVGADLGSWPEY